MTITAEKNPTRVAGRSRLAVVGVTVAVALTGWAILAPLAGIDLKANQGTTIHVGAASVLFASATMSLAGWALLALLERKTINARKVWTVVAVIACITSLGSPLTTGIGLPAKLALASLHLLVAATTIQGLRRTALTAHDRCTPTA